MSLLQNKKFLGWLGGAIVVVLTTTIPSYLSYLASSRETTAKASAGYDALIGAIEELQKAQEKHEIESREYAVKIAKVEATNDLLVDQVAQLQNRTNLAYRPPARLSLGGDNDGISVEVDLPKPAFKKLPKDLNSAYQLKK